MSEFKKMRAAGYARVSTEEEIQEGSYDLQVQYFRDMIMEDPNLELVGIYGDFGITGRDAEKRPGLQQMLKDCDDGKIEVIYTKSVSRFARNIADMVEIVMHLRKIGVECFGMRWDITSAQYVLSAKMKYDSGKWNSEVAPLIFRKLGLSR